MCIMIKTPELVFLGPSPTSDATRVFTLGFSLFSLTPLFIQNNVFCYHSKKSYQQYLSVRGNEH